MKTLRAISTVEYEVPNHCQIPVLPFGVEKHVLLHGEIWKPELAWRRCDQVAEETTKTKSPPAGFIEKESSSKLQWVKKKGNGKARREKIRRRLAKKGIQRAD
jgi:hypothetical protein